MSFPTIPTGTRVLWSTNLSPSGTHTFGNLSSLTKNSGDLLIAIIIQYDGNSTNAEYSSWGGGFTEFVDQATTTTMGIGAAYKWSTGSETGTFTVTSADASTSDSACVLLSIPGAHATTPPEGGTIANNAAAAADPGSFNPAGWDSEDTLWIAVGASGEVSTTGSYTGITAAPTNYTDYSESGITADAIGGVEGAVAFRQLTAASEDVGGFSVDLSNARNSALLIAVRPAPASAATFDPTAIGSGESVSSPILKGQSYLQPTAMASAEAFGAHILYGLTAISPAAMNSAEAFGSHVLAPGSVVIVPASITSEETFGTHTFYSLAYIIPNAIDGAEAFGSHLFETQGGPILVIPLSIASAEAFGSHQILPGAVAIQVPAIDSAENVPQPVIKAVAYITPSSIVSDESIPSPVFLPGGLLILPGSIDSAESLSTPVFKAEAYLYPSSIDSSETIPGGAILPGQVAIQIGAISSAESFGLHILSGVGIVIDNPMRWVLQPGFRTTDEGGWPSVDQKNSQTTEEGG